MEYSHSYKDGEEVEVMLEELGFEDSFYPARVVSKEGPWYYKVAFESLVYKELLDEVVPVDLLRPKPPQVPITGFSLNEEAEVFEDDGWWIGKIRRKFGSDYSFLRSGSDRERSYALEKFRAHHEWKNGRWICHKVLISKM